jgi:hypothetical protein
MSWLPGHTHEHLVKCPKGSETTLRSVLQFRDNPHGGDGSFDRHAGALDRNPHGGDGSFDRHAGALDLVRQLGEVIRCKDEHVAQVEARAEALARDALDQLSNAHTQLADLAAARDTAEAALIKANARLAKLEQALAHSEAQVSFGETQLSSAAARLTKAEVRAAHSEEAIKMLEDALRKELSVLGPSLRHTNIAA